MKEVPTGASLRGITDYILNRGYKFIMYEATAVYSYQKSPGGTVECWDITHGRRMHFPVENSLEGDILKGCLYEQTSGNDPTIMEQMRKDKHGSAYD